jgi:hypothetical protein
MENEDPERELFKFVALYTRRVQRANPTASTQMGVGLNHSHPSNSSLFPPPTRFVRRRSSASVRLHKVVIAPDHSCKQPEPTSCATTPDTSSPLYGKAFDFDHAFELMATHHCTRCGRAGHEAADCHAMADVNGQSI